MQGFSSMAAFDRAMFPAMVRREELEGETPGEAGSRCAAESLDAVAAQRTTVSGTRPSGNEPRELHVGTDGLRRGRPFAA